MLATSPPKVLRFTLSPSKCIQGIDFIASRIPGVTQYYVCKIFYFADKAHIMDWGRPISGDRFVAMEHGPVPSFIYDLLKSDSDQPDEIVDTLLQRVEIRSERNRLHIYSRNEEDFSALSESDKEYLDTSIKKYGHMSFAEVKRLSHEDPAYEAAWSQLGLNNEMDISLWFDGREQAIAELTERGLFGTDGSTK